MTRYYWLERPYSSCLWIGTYPDIGVVFGIVFLATTNPTFEIPRSLSRISWRLNNQPQVARILHSDWETYHDRTEKPLLINCHRV